MPAPHDLPLESKKTDKVPIEPGKFIEAVEDYLKDMF